MDKLAAGDYDAALRQVVIESHENMTIAKILQLSGPEAQLSKDIRACPSCQGAPYLIEKEQSAQEPQIRALCERAQIWKYASLLSSKFLHIVHCGKGKDLSTCVLQHRNSLGAVIQETSPPDANSNRRLLVLSGDLIGEFDKGRKQGEITARLSATGRKQLDFRLKTMLQICSFNESNMVLLMDGRHPDMKIALDKHDIGKQIEAEVWVAYSRQEVRELKGRAVFGNDTHRETGYLVLPVSGSAARSKEDRASVSELPYVDALIC